MKTFWECRLMFVWETEKVHKITKIAQNYGLMLSTKRWWPRYAALPKNNVSKKRPTRPTKRYHTGRYFNVRLKADTEPKTKKWKRKKLKSKKRISSEVSVNSSENPWSQPWRREGRLWWNVIGVSSTSHAVSLKIKSAWCFNATHCTKSNMVSINQSIMHFRVVQVIISLQDTLKVGE